MVIYQCLSFSCYTTLNLATFISEQYNKDRNLKEQRSCQQWQLLCSRHHDGRLKEDVHFPRRGHRLFTRQTRTIQSSLKRGAPAVAFFTQSFKFQDLRAVTATADRRSRYLCFMELPGLGSRAVIVSSAALTYILLRGNRK